MKRFPILFVICAAIASAAPPPVASPTAAQRAMLDQYCVGCHNQRSKTANVMFDAMDLNHVSKDARIWERAVRKLRGGMMPPPGARQPDRASVETFVTWLEASLDKAAIAEPNPGRVALHRLNRVEYANAVEDLFGLRVDASALLPKDDDNNGFDNIASVLKVSPSFLDQYISAARVVSNQAVGNPEPAVASVVLRGQRGVDQSKHIEGLPLGTRGGLLVEHLFPADGEYHFNLGISARFGMEYRHTVLFFVDGVKVFSKDVGGDEDLKLADQGQVEGYKAIEDRFKDIKLSLKGGPHKIGLTFIARTLAESDVILGSFVPGQLVERIPRAGNIEVLGPYQPSGAGSLPSRQRIFACHPGQASEEIPCARRILSTLAARAYRRPATDQDLAAPLNFYRVGKETGDFDAGIRNAIPAILASPKFLYRAEKVPENAIAGANYQLSDLELASRLSFFLWSRPPDEELIKVATAKQLHDPVVLQRQVRRLLADSNAKALVSNFAFQWLKLRAIDDIEPDAILFPSFDESLRDAFRNEIQLFMQSVLLEDHGVLDLLSANYTFLNERLALHYDIKNIRGERFRRVTLTDQNRWGLLGKGGVLMVTSYPNRTAPVLRGAWVLENISGTPPSPPPPNVEGFKENKVGEKAKTVREIMVEHRANPSCNACHGVMDPLGFALENFDAIGAWRTKDRDAGTFIDASGKLVDGTPVTGPSDLRLALMKKPDQFVETLTEKLLMYALGRNLEPYDMPTVRKIVRDASRDGYRFSAIVTGIVKSPPFQMRQVPAGQIPGAVVAAAGRP